LCAVLVSPEGDLGWAVAGEEAGGDGEIGEPFYLCFVDPFRGVNYIPCILAQIQHK
jgi:hypothetical protein